MTKQVSLARRQLEVYFPLNFQPFSQDPLQLLLEVDVQITVPPAPDYVHLDTTLNECGRSGGGANHTGKRTWKLKVSGPVKYEYFQIIKI